MGESGQEAGRRISTQGLRGSFIVNGNNKASSRILMSGIDSCQLLHITIEDQVLHPKLIAGKFPDVIRHQLKTPN